MFMYVDYPRRFANEYEVGIATSDGACELYERMGFERISRDQALSKLTDRGDDATQIYASASIDGADGYCRFAIARALLTGEPLPPPWY